MTPGGFAVSWGMMGEGGCTSLFTSFGGNPPLVDGGVGSPPTGGGGACFLRPLVFKCSLG